MRTSSRRVRGMAVATVVALTVSVTPAQAGPIRRACLKADREAASRQLCSCIDRQARTIFSYREMRRIAKFFKDPHLTQLLRQSTDPADRQLWEKYTLWAQLSAALCR